MNNKYINNERGQALLFVVVALTVALAIGMSVSTRTISSVKRSTSTDTSSRVYSAAEGGIEWFLRQPTSVLNALADGNNNSGADCPAGTTDYAGDDKSCVISYTSATGDNISSIAIVAVDPFTFNNPAGSTNHYWFYINSGEVKEIRLNGTYNGNLRICWATQDSSATPIIPDLYYTVYNNASGIINKGILRNSSGSHSGSTEEGVTAASMVINGTTNTFYTNLDFTECATLNIPNASSARGLRLKSMYAPSKVGVFPLTGTLPTQGYTINSIGQLQENETIKTVKKLKVFRSYEYMPSVFDYAIYSDTPLGITP